MVYDSKPDSSKMSKLVVTLGTYEDITTYDVD